jgi:hypothetical protein
MTLYNEWDTREVQRRSKLNNNYLRFEDELILIRIRKRRTKSISLDNLIGVRKYLDMLKQWIEELRNWGSIEQLRTTHEMIQNKEFLETGRI